MAPDNDVDTKGERGGDTGPTKKQGKGSGSVKGDARREKEHTGPTRNSPAARRSENDEQGGQRNTK